MIFFLSALIPSRYFWDSLSSRLQNIIRLWRQWKKDSLSRLWSRASAYAEHRPSALRGWPTTISLSFAVDPRRGWYGRLSSQVFGRVPHQPSSFCYFYIIGTRLRCMWHNYKKLSLNWDPCSGKLHTFQCQFMWRNKKSVGKFIFYWNFKFSVRNHGLL